MCQMHVNYKHIQWESMKGIMMFSALTIADFATTR